MFVQNCRVVDKEIRYKKESPSKKRKSNSNEQIKKPSTENYKPYQYIDSILVEDEHLFDEQIYKLVYCKLCDTEVAVMDSDEMYHFFNVIPSEV